jgi:sugar (pentulose or hexulose) kinase
VLDWARSIGAESEQRPNRDIPIFLPWLNGERSLEWNPELKPVWHGRRSNHSPNQLRRAITEGVVFNLSQYVEVIEKVSGIRAGQMVFSGNGFLDAAVAPMLAALLNRDARQPKAAGYGTLRGAAVTAWRALGHDAVPEIERMLLRTEPVKPMDDEFLQERFLRFKELRNSARS